MVFPCTSKTRCHRCPSCTKFLPVSLYKYLTPLPSSSNPSLAMAILALRLSLIFSLCLLTRARLPLPLSHSKSLSFPDEDRFLTRGKPLVHSKSLSFPDEHRGKPLVNQKPDYSNSFVFAKPLPEILSESRVVPGEMEFNAVDGSSLRHLPGMSFDHSFRPIKPGFRPILLTDRRPLGPRRHRCHHRHQIRGPHVRVPYGDDMIVGGMREGSRGETRENVPTMVAVTGRPEEERAGEESGLRSWFWNIIDGF